MDLAWSTPIGTGLTQSSIAVGSDGTIYVVVSHPDLKASTWYALAPDGGVLWTFPLSITGWSSPAIGDDGTMYVGSREGSGAVGSDGQLIAVDPSGTLKWVQDDLGKVQSSPALGADGTIYVGTNRGVFALDPEDGEIEWTYEAIVSVSSPAVANDGTVYVGATDKLLHAINPDGSGRWTFPPGSWILAAPTVGADGTVYFGSAGGRLFALDSDGSERWSLLLEMAGVESSPAIGSDGTVYVRAGELFAIDPSGSIRWRHPDNSFGQVHSPVVGGDGTVYFGSSDRGVTAVGTDGNVKWHYAMLESHLGSPAIGIDGTIIAASTAFNGASSVGICTIRAFVEKGTSNGGYASSPWPTARGGRDNSGRAGG
jgi:outer membrane protein assembly factor BamB